MKQRFDYSEIRKLLRKAGCKDTFIACMTTVVISRILQGFDASQTIEIWRQHSRWRKFFQSRRHIS